MNRIRTERGRLDGAPAASAADRRRAWRVRRLVLRHLARTAGDRPGGLTTAEVRSLVSHTAAEVERALATLCADRAIDGTIRREPDGRPGRPEPVDRVYWRLAGVAP